MLRNCLTVCVLNTENTLNVELQFELVDLCTSNLFFLSANNILLGWPFDEGNIIKPDAVYGCETWPYRLTDKQWLKVFEEGVMRKIF